MSKDPHSYYPDHAQPTQKVQYPHPPTALRKNSWLKAFWLCITDNKTAIATLFARRLVYFALATDAVFTAWNVVDDFLVPVLGSVDDPLLFGEVPTGIALAVLLYLKVKPYRYTTQ